MKRILAILAVAATFTAVPAFAHPGHNYITEVNGSPRHGFTVQWHNGTEYLPTKSEARAECHAYSRATKRARCIGKINGTYQTLKQTKRALRNAAVPTTPCANDEATNVPCYWDAGMRGNGRGYSFWVDARGNVHYLDPEKGR